jgi:ribosome recycling factor
MNISLLESKFEKSLGFLKTELTKISTGRAKPSLIEDLKIDAYGSQMLLKELGSITLSDNQTLLIAPWDKGLIGAITKAIRESDLNLNPAEDSDKIRIPIPSLNEERRSELSKVVALKVEEVKKSIRSIRQEAMKEIDKDFSDKKISEDGKFSGYKKVDDAMKDYLKKVDDAGDSKKKDLMTV